MADERFEKWHKTKWPMTILRESEESGATFADCNAEQRLIGWQAGVQSHREAVGKRLRELAKFILETKRCIDADSCRNESDHYPCYFTAMDRIVEAAQGALADEIDPPVVAEEGKRG